MIEPHDGLVLCGRIEMPWMPTLVYYIFAGQQLLYVGVSTNLVVRLAAHASNSWWSKVTHVDWVDFATLEEARAYAEQIRSLDPPEKTMHRPLLRSGL